MSKSNVTASCDGVIVVIETVGTSLESVVNASVLTSVCEPNPSFKLYV